MSYMRDLMEAKNRAELENIKEQMFDLQTKPVLDFDVDIMTDWMKQIKPEWINIGADSSRRKDLPEP